MTSQVQTVMHCGLIAGCGALACYVITLIPGPQQVKQLTSIGIGIVATGLILRIGGLL